MLLVPLMCGSTCPEGSTGSDAADVEAEVASDEVTCDPVPSELRCVGEWRQDFDHKGLSRMLRVFQ